MTPGALRRLLVTAPALAPALALFVSLALATPALHALDDLFEDPDQGVVEEDEAIGDETDPIRDEPDEESPRTPATIDLGALTTSPVRFSGSVDSGIGISLGLAEWPGTKAAQEIQDDDDRDPVNVRGGYDMSTTLRVTARPRPYLRFTGTLTSSLNRNTARFSNPAVGEMFVDYTLRDLVFFRAGTYGLTWGQARILPNIGNIVSDMSDGVALRATVAAGPGTVTTLMYTRRAEIENRGAGNPRAFTYAGQWEITRGRVSTGVAARLRAEDPVRATAYTTIGLGTLGPGTTDITLEGLVRLDRRDPWSEETRDFQTLAQLVWEGGDPAWRLIAEHSYDRSVVYGTGGFADGDRTGHRDNHLVALGLRMPRFLPRRWRPEIVWRHAFSDDSGQVETLFSGNLAPGLEGNIGIPVKYGKPGTFYRGEDTEIPENGVVSVLLAARLKFSF